ncbi:MULTISPECIES: helicase-exonuclease AddAB subunit AddA [Clostridium]|uniref:helicase-exonuclease AddAB subunit AddA n=1 Tax=Clostridium TaxID=1485 RepID=UPI0013FA3E9A|nr:MULTISPECIES: helicase-exonuclease AddAB subunit AddA [Clostridium]MBY7025819.1 helicase-exonuclease AddAB subunit AddA [Clostridium botulinum]NFO48575.1 helicase-exonuclease AddAB subunit AddA [Clostridium botulinum]
MSGTKWTEEQLSAITTRDCNLLVAAAAGSGKTAVLVERIIKIITNEENPIDIDKLLVVTFTSAAAAEMRERIANAISKKLDETPTSKNLQKQLTLLNRSNIMTIHSFCLGVIKNNFHKIDLDPSFRICDQTEGILLKMEIIDELFDDKYDEENQEFIKFIEAFSSYKSDNALKELVLSLYNFIMAGPWPKKWLKAASEDFDIKTLQELDESKWVSVLKESIKIELDGYIKMMQKAVELINETDGLEPYFEGFSSELDLIVNAYNNVESSLNDLYNSLNLITFNRLKTIKKNTVSDENIQNLVKQIRDQVKKKISALIEGTFIATPDKMLDNIIKSYPYINQLTELTSEFIDRFNAKKKEKNILDFNDLEHLCLKILIEDNEENQIVPSTIAQKFKDYFEEVLVDEYQDSNNVQEAIIELVSRKNSDNPNVFMVGDVKQSIYKFRQAKPELFIDKYNSYSLDKCINRKIQLYKNFRSREEVINGVNYIFKSVMSKTVGELEYTDVEALNLGASYPEKKNVDDIIGGPIEVHILDRSDNKEENDESKLQAEEEEIGDVNLEARIIVKRINDLISKKDGSKFKVLDKDTGEYRDLKYKDIVILLRATKNWSEVLLDELGLAGIPVYADTGSGYFESIEIRTIMSLLKVIDNPMQDVPMLSLLISPIIGLSAEELTDIRLIDKEKYFYENIIKISTEKLISEELQEKCEYILSSIDKWRRKSIYMPIDEFIWYLYMDTAYYGYVGAMPNGVLRQANLKILFQRARQFSETSFKGLFNFINFINKLTKSSGDMGSAKILGENEDVVRIMSIHKSKGLEFPVVFLAGCGKNFNLMDLNNKILYHEELGLGPEYINLENRTSITTLPKEAIKKRMKLETLSEEMRVLYVAFTRAKEKLIITGAVRNAEKSIEKWINSAVLDKDVILPYEISKGKSYLDWIGMALCKHKDGKILRKKLGFSSEMCKDDLSMWKISIWNKYELDMYDELDENQEELDVKISILDKDVNKKVKSEVYRRLGYEYEFKESTKLTSNISVSDLKRRNMNDNIDTLEIFDLEEEDNKNKDVITPKFLQEKKGISSAERGTAIHFAMKKIDFSKVGTLKEIKEQLNELYEEEFILQEEYSSINPYKILSFFKSNLGKKMLDVYNKGGKIYREIPFHTEISSLELDESLPQKYANEKIRLQGIIDCFFKCDDEIILLDYKTDYVENEEEFKEKYKSQLLYYSEAVFKMTGKKVNKRYLYSFYLEKEILI